MFSRNVQEGRAIISTMKRVDYLALGFVSNDHLAVLPFIPMDTKVKIDRKSVV